MLDTIARRPAPPPVTAGREDEGRARGASLARRSLLVSLLALPVAAAARPDSVRAALEEVLRGRAAEEGGIEIAAPRLAENGQQVPITVLVPDAEARAIHLIATANPTPGVATSASRAPRCRRGSGWPRRSA
jgi:predicted secreted protein